MMEDYFFITRVGFLNWEVCFWDPCKTPEGAIRGQCCVRARTRRAAYVRATIWREKQIELCEFMESLNDRQ